MIITLKKPVGDILQMLNGKKRVAIIGCGQCATICRTGGEVKKVIELDELVAVAGNKFTPTASVKL
ncbi:MAG: 5,10-methylenetetrahydrofolate reductase, partial [Candidatus Altiarchaeota archaeon]|nr:5,10-methylenetetrahydrofolate reductase [Candidatus Altiarchaeota archaeon]